MIGFNLLPWREQQQIAFRKQYLKLLIGLSLLSSLLIGYWFLQTTWSYTEQTEQIQRLKARESELEDKLLEQMQLSKKLQRLKQEYQHYRQLAQWPYKLLTALSMKMPSDSYLLQLSLSNTRAKLTGYASGLKSVQKVLRQLNGLSPAFKASLQGLNEQQSQYSFIINAQYDVPVHLSS